MGTIMPWDIIHPNIRAASETITLAGKYDDAIFAAFRTIEAEIQQRAKSKSIGQHLLDEAFDGQLPKIEIADAGNDRIGIKSLFSGALSNIRNDRGHKKVPFLPCSTPDGCHLYLSFASFLLYLLDRDRNVLPHIDAVRVFGTDVNPRVEIRGQNFRADAIVLAEEQKVDVVRLTSESIEAILPSPFVGYISIRDKGINSNKVLCDSETVAKEPKSTYEALHADLPLFSDPKCTRQRSGVFGLLIRATESGRAFLRIVPTRYGRYKAGNYITHGPWEKGGVDESWYRDPDTGEPKYAWTGSLVMCPDVLGPAAPSKLVGITLLPQTVSMPLNSRRYLRPIGWFQNGPVRIEQDIAAKVSWQTSNEKIAYAKGSTLFGKGLGTANIECRLETYFAKTSVSIGSAVRGERTIYLEGFRRLQHIRFDADNNLYFVNQGPSVWRISHDGTLDEVIRVSSLESQPVGIDCLAIDSNNIYVNDLHRRVCLRFPFANNQLGSPKTIATLIPKCTKKGIAIDSNGNVFVAVLDNPKHGWIIRVSPDGNESVIDTQHLITCLAINANNEICTPSNDDHAVHVYGNDGTLRHTYVHGIDDSSSDIAIDATGAFILPFFYSGKVFRVHPDRPSQPQLIAEGFRNPCGVAFDAAGQLYVSNFGGMSIEKVSPD